MFSFELVREIAICHTYFMRKKYSFFTAFLTTLRCDENGSFPTVKLVAFNAVSNSVSLGWFVATMIPRNVSGIC